MRILKISLFVLLFFGCKDPVYKVDAEIKDHSAYMQHEWQLVRVLQTDSKAGPGKLKELDITNAVLGGGTSKLNFSSNEYTVTGFLTSLFGESGSWSFDNPKFPTKLILNTNNDTKEVTLGKSILEFSTELYLNEERYFCKDNSESVKYSYILEKK